MIKLFINLKVCWSVPHYHVTCGSFSDLFSPCFKDPHRLSYISFLKNLRSPLGVLRCSLASGNGCTFYRSFCRCQIFFTKFLKNFCVGTLNDSDKVHLMLWFMSIFCKFWRLSSRLKNFLRPEVLPSLQYLASTFLPAKWQKGWGCLRTSHPF